MKNKTKKGFTLIELLVVVAIMGLLAALAIVALNQARAKARDARRVSDIKQIQTALELYYLDNNEYPDKEGDTSTNIIEDKCLSSTNGFKDACAGTVYMAELPSNPLPRVDGSCTDTEYTYVPDVTTGHNLSYHISYCLGSATGDLASGPHIATPAGLTDN